MSRLGLGCRAVLLASFAAISLGPGRLKVVTEAEVHASEDEAVVEEEQGAGLRFKLGEGIEAAAATVPPAAPAPAERLSDGDVERLLGRLPPFSAAAEEKEFALREESLPPPRPGKTIKEEFPPAATQAASRPEAAPTGPLTVLRHAPDGPVPIAPHLSVTFSQPMVAVTSLAELAAEQVPVRLQPQPPGKWRWVGTQTLLFEPSGRFPMATVYKIEIPGDTKSPRGAAIVKAVSWSFSTPPPQLVSSYPQGGPSRRDTLLFAAFDQKIDPAAVLASIRARAGRDSPSLKLATADEIKHDPEVRRMADDAGEGRWLAFRTDPMLPADSQVDIVIGPGTPSAEGPRTTEKPQKWTFRTFGPMRVVDKRCGWGNRCTPFMPWSIQFSNPIDARAFNASMVTVEPELPGMKTVVGSQYLTITGRTKGRTTYRVTLSSAIPDEFGQTLVNDAVVSFDVGPADERLFAQGGALVTLDPTGPPRFPVYTINEPTLKVSAYAVGPESWHEYLTYLRDDERDQTRRDPPGRKVISTTVKVKGAPDELTETPIDLSSALSNGVGHVILIVEPPAQPKERWKRQIVRAWIQSTRLALDAFVDDTDLVAWTNALDKGTPLHDVSVTLFPSGAAATSGPDGLATLPLPAKSGNLLVARLGNDTAILPESTSWWDEAGSWQRRQDQDEIRWMVFDDRKMYRPGEEVRIKGWIRRVGAKKGGDVDALKSASALTMTYILSDSVGNTVIENQKTAVNVLGGFDFALKLPATMNLGEASVALTVGPLSESLNGENSVHSFQVAEFRRPEYEVKATPSEGPYFVGDHATVTAVAAYYAGGGLPNAEVNWQVTSSAGSFTPPNRDDFIFGTWVPWWEEIRHPGEDSHTEQYSAHTDAGGKHVLRIDFDSVNPPRPSNVEAEATVMDVNRQAWSATANLLVHPSHLYVGIKSDRLFVREGDPLKIDSIVTDLDGKAVPKRRVSMRCVRLDWVQEAGEWREKAVDRQECETTSGTDPVRCTFQTKEGGVYKVTATVVDDSDLMNQSEMTIWVTGGKTPPSRTIEKEKVTLVPEKKQYRPGETAEVLVMAPFSPAEGLITLRRSGLVHTERLTMKSSSEVVRVKIEDAYTPNIYLQVDLTGSAPRTDDKGEIDTKLPPRPAYASGSINLAVPPASRTLTLHVTPRASKLEPGGETVLDAELHDAGGKPVAGGELAVVVVDEAVLSLTGYRLPDPMAIFYSERDAGARDAYFRESVLLSNPLELVPAGDEAKMADLNTVGYAPPPAPAMKMAAPMAEAARPTDGGSGGAAPPPIRVRTDFSALALFASSVPTDADGRAHVPVKLPDNLSRYRIMVVAVAGGRQFGAAESAITARLPLMVRPSPPRFLNFGDRFEMPVVVQNQTDSPLRVDVAMRAANAELTAGAGRRVSVPANDRVEVRFPAAAARAGTARFQVGAASGRWADANEFQLPVWTPATTEAFATYGHIDVGAIAQEVTVPRDVVADFGGLEITTSSTALQALTDAVLYLVSYRFECAEQLASRVVTIAALRDVLTAFQAEGLPKPDDMIAAVKRDVERLRNLQNPDGGFPFWQRGDESWPYVSIYATHALVVARDKGFDVPSDVLDRASRYLKDIDRHFPSKYPADVRRTLVAYSLYVRQLLGSTDAARGRRLCGEAGVDKLPLEAAGWLLPVLSADRASVTQVAAIRLLLANRVEETAGAASFTCSYGDGAYLLLHSNRRTDGVLLDALIGDQPKSDLIPKLVSGLLAHRRAGRWGNTQENAFILLALDRYFNTYEKITPDFVARAWLGEQYAGEHTFKGRTTERDHVDVPMKFLMKAGVKTDVTLSREGEGRLYYRIGMRYAPSSLKLDPYDAGFTVERVYQVVDAKDDVRRDADGTWHIKAGARVRVRLTMVAPARRYHVALVDPLPAGLEGLNPELAVTGSIPAGPSEDVTVEGAPGLGRPEGFWWWWTRPWYEHVNMRDDRVEAFTSLLWEGVYTYTYVARATTPGTFVVPPPKAEEMYAPETFGRGAGDRVVVE